MNGRRNLSLSLPFPLSPQDLVNSASARERDDDGEVPPRRDCVIMRDYYAQGMQEAARASGIRLFAKLRYLARRAA